MKYDFQRNDSPATAAPENRGGLDNQEQDPAARAAEAKKKLQRRIEAMATQINRFRVDVQRFFAGDLPQPPEELRDAIRIELRRLQSSRAATAADGFRLNALEAQFNSHVELYGRRLRQREQGGIRRKVERTELQHDANKGVLFGAKGSVEALYKGFFLKGRGAKPAMDFDRFRGHLQKQVVAIQAKTGAADIQFRIAEENGKMKIKAKPIKKKAGA